MVARLYVDTKTKQIFAEVGTGGGGKLGNFERVDENTEATEPRDSTTTIY